jgi:hypothetical protein
MRELLARFGEGKWVGRAVVRLGGPLPSLNAPLEAKLRWLRRLHVGFYVLVYGVGFAGIAVFGAPLWLWVVVGVGTIAWLWNVISLSIHIRRERRRV